KILRQYDDAAAAGDGFGHPPACDRGHVGDDYWARGARPVDGGQVDVEPRRDIRAVRNDEDVVVGQVVRGRVTLDKSHDTRLGVDFGAVSAPQRVELAAALVVDPLIGVRAEAVALGAARRSRTAPSRSRGSGCRAAWR